MGAAEDAALNFVEECVKSADQPTDDRQVDAISQREQLGVAAQVLAEGVECTEVLLGLTQKGRIVFKGVHHHRVVDMGDGEVSLLKLFAEKDVFVAATLEALVEATVHKCLVLDHEVGGAKLLIWVLLTTYDGVGHLCLLLIAVSQVALPACISGDADATVDDTKILCGQIALDEIVVGDGDVAVDEQQMVVLALGGKEIACRRTATVLFPGDESAAGLLADSLILDNGVGIRRAVVGYDNLVIGVCCL